MAEPKRFEMPVGVFGQGLLAFNIAGWVLLLLEKKEQWEMLAELNRHLSFLSGSLWFIPSVVSAFLLTLIAQELRFKRFVTENDARIIYEGEHKMRVRSDWLWVKVTALVIFAVILLTTAGAIIALRFYDFQAPTLVQRIPVPRICKTADCVPKSRIAAKKQTVPPVVVNAPGGIPIVGNTGTVNNPTVNNYAPPERHLDDETKKQLNELYQSGLPAVVVYSTADGELYRLPRNSKPPRFSGRRRRLAVLWRDSPRPPFLNEIRKSRGQAGTRRGRLPLPGSMSQYIDNHRYNKWLPMGYA